ncbi:DEAD/DEAH box helicase family protein [Mariniluteicoccus endophyticus]
MSAEALMHTDPRSACMNSRVAVELLVNHLYDVRNLRRRGTRLADLESGSQFRQLVGAALRPKFKLVRLNGNKAAHGDAVTPAMAESSLRELHHIMVWAARHQSTVPDEIPTQVTFDPQRVGQVALLNRAQVQALLDRQHAAYQEHLDQTSAERDRELEELRAQIEAAQAAATQPDTHDYDEARTRTDLIDALLAESGWQLDQPRDREFEVSGMPNQQGVGYVDYVLWGDDGRPLAVVEAKRTSRSAHEGQQQAKLYADCLEDQFQQRPVIFYTNGYETWIWDDALGYPPREVMGFPTRDELSTWVRRRQNRRQLETQTISNRIVNRGYQQEAIKRIGEAFENHRRGALLVMATGTGKTRTAIALVDLLMKAGWVTRTLFLADRTALAKQAFRSFQTFLNEPVVNLLEDRTATGRVYVSTYQTMMNLIEEPADGRRFSPGHFDLVIIDEAHRSVYAKYGAIFRYFDSLLVGQTATPKNEVDRNTYRLFGLEDGMPTDAYDLEEAVREGHLVPPRGVATGTLFLRDGIRYEDLPEEERDAWDEIEWGEDGPPDAISSEEINRSLFNTDTVDKVLGTLMEEGYKVAGGDRIGKTIIFAKNMRHAEFIEQRFNANWPEYGGTFARRIVHGESYAASLIDEFSQPDHEPHIAISVDMLDTGIDIPEVVNLVFFKLVRSKSKFWQMIGRGTRLCPDLFGPGEHKQDFLVFDFCGNLDYFSQNLPGSTGSVQRSLGQRLFETRVELVRQLDRAEDFAGRDELRRDTAETLRTFVTGMNPDNILVRPHRAATETFSDPSAWEDLTDERVEEALALAGLPSQEQDVDEGAKRFDLLMLGRILAQVTGDVDTAERIRVTVQRTVEKLLSLMTIPAVQDQAELIGAVAGDEWWVDVMVPMVEAARRKLRGLIGFIERSSSNPVYTDFEDTLIRSRDVDLPGVTSGIDLERFRARATEHLRAHDDNMALQRLRRNKPLTDEDLETLEQLLIASGGQRADIVWCAERQGGLGVFVRSLVGLDHAAVTEAFADFLDENRYTADQIRFVRTIIEELTANGVMGPDRLFDSPYNDRRIPFEDAELITLTGRLREFEETAAGTKDTA